jgi:hypothetical protein
MMLDVNEVTQWILIITLLVTLILKVVLDESR